MLKMLSDTSSSPETSGFNISTKDILQEQVIATQNISNPQVRESEKLLENRQKALEYKLLDELNLCPIPQAKDLNPNIEASEVKSLMGSQFYNDQAIKAAVCVTDSIVSYKPMAQLSQQDRIRRWLNNLRQIGSESVAGYAMTADLDDVKDVFVIKAPRDPEDTSLTHEMFVGLFGTNIMRSIGVPNYSYIFGGFKCSGPVIGADKTVTSWCSSGPGILHNQVQYVIYENITNAISFGKYIQTCNAQQFLSSYMQIIYALRAGLEVCGFTHYDLHPENVLQKNLGQPFQIRYPSNNGFVYLLQQDARLGIMIDYGQSHISVNGSDFGIIDKDQAGIWQQYFNYRDSSWWVHDAYKLLMFSMAYSRGRFGSTTLNNSVFDQCVKLFRFFNKTETPEQALASQESLLYIIPQTKNTVLATIDNYIDYIKSVCDCSFISITPHKDTAIMSCDGNFCLTMPESMSQVGLTPPPKPTTLFDLYDVLSSGVDISLRQSVVNSTTNNINNLYASFDVNTRQRIKRLNNLIANTVNKNLTLLNVKLSDPILNQYKQLVSNVLEIKEIKDDLSIRMSMIINLKRIYPTLPQDLVPVIDAEVTKANMTLSDLSEIIRDNKQFIRSLIASVPKHDLIKYPILQWFSGVESQL